jgi:hypothetical protein
MLKFSFNDWCIRIQPNILVDYSDIAQIDGYKSLKIAGNFEREVWIEFEMAEQETLFALRFA